MIQLKKKNTSAQFFSVLRGYLFLPTIPNLMMSLLDCGQSCRRRWVQSCCPFQTNAAVVLHGKVNNQTKQSKKYGGPCLGTASSDWRVRHVWAFDAAGHAHLSWCQQRFAVLSFFFFPPHQFLLVSVCKMARVAIESYEFSFVVAGREWWPLSDSRGRRPSSSRTIAKLPPKSSCSTWALPTPSPFASPYSPSSLKPVVNLWKVHV